NALTAIRGRGSKETVWPRRSSCRTRPLVCAGVLLRSSRQSGPSSEPGVLQHVVGDDEEGCVVLAEATPLGTLRNCRSFVRSRGFGRGWWLWRGWLLAESGRPWMAIALTEPGEHRWFGDPEGGRRPESFRTCRAAALGAGAPGYAPYGVA